MNSIQIMKCTLESKELPQLSIKKWNHPHRGGN